jgi:hypothetical protein
MTTSPHPARTSSRHETRATVRAWVELVGPAGLALVLSLLALAAGLRGTDVAAQTYRAEVVRLHGFVLWDSGWYGGSFPSGYSALSPTVSAYLGVAASSVLAAVLATWCFDGIIRTVTGRRTLGSWYFAVSTLLAVSIGQVPYLTGEAVALASILAIVRGRPKLGAALGVASALFSPLAAAFLVMVCVVWAVHGPTRRRSMLATAAGATALVVVLGALFPGTGPFPFHWAGLVVVELLCLTVLSPVVRTTPAVRLAAAVYGLASLGSFLVPNPLGGNAVRLAESVGLPLVASLMSNPLTYRPHLRGGRIRRSGRRVLAGPARLWQATSARPLLRRPALAFAVFVPFAVWQWAPGTGVVASAATTPADTAAFYQPLIAHLRAADGDRPVRVEIVPTFNHWESAYVGPYVGLARGWERQLDVADNPIFYTAGALDVRSYRSWLDANGVAWVALPQAKLDYAGTGEAALLRHRHIPGLRLVWSTPSWELWHVDGTPGLVTGAATLTTLAPDRVGLSVHRPGDLLLRVRYITYWNLSAGAACVLPAPGGWTEVHVAAAGQVELQASLLDGHPATCPSH